MQILYDCEPLYSWTGQGMQRRTVEPASKWPPRQTSVVLAARSALRALPLLDPKQNKYDHSLASAAKREQLILYTFRALFVAWASAIRPASFEPIANNAAHMLSGILPQSGAALVAASAASSAAKCAGVPDPGVAALHAEQTISHGSYASNSRAKAFSADYQLIAAGREPTTLMNEPLWLISKPPLFEKSLHDLELYLLNLQSDWDVWTTWYLDRFHGYSMSAAVILAWMNTPSSLWNTSASFVNAELKRLRTHPESETVITQKEPEPEPGPEFDIGEQGLSIKQSLPPEGLSDERTQRELHDRLRRIAPLLERASLGAANAHPGLYTVAAEYATLISSDFKKIDVTGLWAVGAGLLANRDAFARAHDSRTMTDPLEPDHFALLQQACEIHGGFILGFPQGKDLAERADRARVSGEAMERVVTLSRSIIEELRRSGRQVESHTRKFLAAIEQGLIEPGWRFTRAGYAAYVVTRNALIAIGRLLSWANSAFATVAGGIALNKVDPGLVQTQFWIEFVLRNSPQILAFAEPFPELKIWLAAQIEAAQFDKEGAARKRPRQV